MIKHIVAFKLRDPADAPALRALLLELGAEPSVRHWEVGINAGSSSRPYEVAVYSEFEDMSGLEAFRRSAPHAAVKEAMASLIETSGTIDYEAEARD